jgi:hypothetical protein
MSSQARIDAPFALASLPRPGTTTAGRTQAAGVYSISGAKKRKRAEVAVAVDGEGISVYSLQNPQLVTSYALPPQTSFATAPYSLYRKGASKHSSFRYTYVATQSGPGDKAQIICFTEETRRDGTTDTAKTTCTVPETAGEIAAIESVLQSGDAAKSGSHDVLVVFASGHSICLSADLETSRWEADLGKDIARIEYVALTTAKAAIGGLLRSRQDIAAILDPTFEGKAEVLSLVPVLCAVLQLSGNRRALGLFHIQPRSADIISTRRLPLNHLITWDLPSSPKPATESPQRTYHLHSSTGILHQLVDSHILSYDFTGTVPKLYSDFHIPGSSISSFLRIASDLVLTTTEKSLGLFDVKYSSVQAVLPLGQGAASASDSKKRKHADQGVVEQENSLPTLISYFAESGLAVGISGNEIVGIQVAETSGRKRFKSNDTLLINAIGKGISATESKGMLKSSAQWHEWQRRVHKLDKYSSKGKVADFENVFAQYLKIQVAEPATKAEDSSTAQEKTANGTNAADDSTQDELRKWILPETLADSERTHFRHCALYALRKIFHYVQPKSTSSNELRYSSLEVEFFPPNVFQWLLLAGYVTKESIRRSFMEGSPDEFDVTVSIADGDIVKAIVQFDPELHILSAVLNSGHFLPVGEVVQSIRVLMQSLDDRPAADDVAGLLTNGKESSNDEIDVELDSELEAATHDLDHAMSILNNGVLIRSHNLRPALIRLHTFPVPVIAATLRTMLRRRELESLIRLLHTELRNGGWTSPYDFHESENPEDPDDQAVAIIASLLGCALDAIGAGAWLASIGDSASEESSEDIIQDLLHDTSEALNGFWEARFMRGLLSEFLRYASNVPKSHKPTNQKLQKQGKPFAEEIAADDALPMLPLGGKVDLGVETTRRGKGGKSEARSAREIGMLISKRVPKYSVERIVI